MRTRVVFQLIVLSFLPVLLIFAGTVRAHDEPPPPPPSIKLPPGEMPVQLTRLDYKVFVSGLEAETTVTMIFHNPNERVLAGDLEFPLPDGATVAGYALDVGGRMVEGVVVPRQKARVVMETEMRRGIDPGIVEHVRGNYFRTRVFPIPANGDRTIRVVYVSTLSLSGGDAAYHLPLPHGVALPSLSLRVEVARGAVKPELGGFGNLSFTEWNDLWVAEAVLSSVTPGDDLYVRLPKIPDRLTAVEEFDGELYLAISDRPSLPKPGQGEAPDRIAVAWDASGSRNIKAVERDIEFLQALFRLWRNCTVDLVVFRDRPEALGAFTILDGDAGDLLELLTELPYDGGTDLGALDLRRKAVPHEDVSTWLVFTDGLYTMGSGLPAFGDLPVYVIAADSRRDTSLQRLLAKATGGMLLDLTTTDPADAATLLADPPPVLMGVDAPSGTLADVQYRFPVGASRATIHARLLRDTEVTLIYGVGGREHSRTQIEVKRDDAIPGRVLARAWAASRTADLSVFPEQNADEILALGRRYGIVTPGTSLIVLENLQQYLEYEITPPESWSEMHNQYMAALKNRHREDKQSRDNKIDRVLTWWHQRVAWWEREFSYSDDFRWKAKRQESRSRRTAGNEADSGVLMEMSPEASAVVMGYAAAPAPASEPAEGEMKALQRQEAAAAISIKVWDPQTPYLADIKSRPGSEAYSAYLEQRRTYADSPSFFLDCAGYFFQFDRALGLRILSNLAELRIEDAALLRVYAWRLREAGVMDLAIEVLERVKNLRPEEPQSYRDLALILAARMDRDGEVSDGVRAAELLNHVIMGEWQRFEQIEVIALMELNRLLAIIEGIDPTASERVGIDLRLRRLLDLDVRIVLSWDADNTDIDLHVIEPSGEEAFYSHNLTTIGGLVSRDFTQGYGPEEYVLRHAMPGTYRIRGNYYGSTQQTLMGPATVTATVITNFGRPGEKRQVLTLRLDNVKGMIDVGEITIGEDLEKISVSRLSRKTIGSLERGMERLEVERILGLPGRVDGSGIIVLLYGLNDGTKVRLGFGPNLLWAREVHSGVERELKLR